MPFGKVSNSTKKSQSLMSRAKSGTEKKQHSFVSVLDIGLSGSGKTSHCVGGRYTTLNENGKTVEVEIQPFKLPMFVIDIGRGASENILTWDDETLEKFTIFEPDQVDEILEVMQEVIENNKAYDNIENNEDTEETPEMRYNTVLLDDVDYIWNMLKSNLTIAKSKSQKIDIVKSVSSGNLKNPSKMKLEGTEYTPASTVWLKFKELLYRLQSYANVYATSGADINTWDTSKGNTLTPFVRSDLKFAFDIWGYSGVDKQTIKNSGQYRKYYFTVERARGSISGITIYDFSYDKLMKQLKRQ
ncbi:MAG: hypothetical protein ACOCQD_00350 [archaeon]